MDIRSKVPRTLLWLTPSAAVVLAVIWYSPRTPIDYNTQVKPILNKRCITCHGGVKRNGDFSLLFRQDALAPAKSGKPAIVPGDPNGSEMIRRLTSRDPEERMPYHEEALPEVEIQTLRRWIEEGAPWGNHWAYVPPERPVVPGKGTLLSGLMDLSTARGDIDLFVYDKLDELGIEPSPQAAPATLIRRVSFDLTGLPPDSSLTVLFLSDPSDQNYEAAVDRLLASDSFGERWASWWLDMARYSDTKGYERDVGRQIWRYRDWVIRAFNEDMPFDQFTIEQLAGDMLPDPTDDQYTATAFHRNTMNNDEGGTEDEEFRVASVIDRVNTTFEVWQSTTISCVQCHSHPYDPFRHEDYYKLYSFFNQSRDEDTEGEYPMLRFYNEEDGKRLDRIRAWAKSVEPEREKEFNKFLRTLEPKIHSHDFDRYYKSELIDTKWLGIQNGGHARLRNVDLTGIDHILLSYSSGHEGGRLEIRRDNPDGNILAELRIAKTQGWNCVSVPIRESEGRGELYFLLKNSNLRGEEYGASFEWLALRQEFPHKGSFKSQSVEDEFLKLINSKPETVPVMIEGEGDLRRTTRVFERGNWLVPGDTVEPALPDVFASLAGTEPKDRLDLAKWLVSENNPLTSRTLVNRLWEQLFGRGLVESLEDFGSQGNGPSHPELLDYLAVRTMTDHKWSVKSTLREIVLSATYRQDSRVTPEMLEKDPGNRWLARGPRQRLTGEQLRDQALAVSGLLNRKMFGPGVMPYQPPGIWQSVWSDVYWKTSEGEDKHRRSVYTYLKRTSPYPSMLTFDGSSREVCQVRRITTNTPLQALVTLNDTVYTEAAIHLARRMKGKGAKASIRNGFFLVLMREPDEFETASLLKLFDEALAEYSQFPQRATSLLSHKEAKPEDASLWVVASAILNLDETLTKE